MKLPIKLPSGKEVMVEIDDKTVEELEKPKKKTGYERVNKNETYYYIEYNGVVESDNDMPNWADAECYNIANYYLDKIVAENNARAETLMRKLRRFAVEHRKKELDWDNAFQPKYSIDYCYDNGALTPTQSLMWRNFCSIYFDTSEIARAAIKEFESELIWYFTEYKDSL